MEEPTKHNVMEQITSGEVNMRPRGFFIARTALMVLGMLVAGMVAIFFTSFALFYLRMSGASSLPGFGPQGMRDLLLSLPWVIVVLAIVFTVIFFWFTEHYPVAYRSPLIYSMVAVVLLVSLGSFAVGETPLHPYFYRTFAPEGKMGIMHRLYQKPRKDTVRNGLIGQVYSIQEGNFTIYLDQTDDNYIVYTINNGYPSSSVVRVGDWVLVYGKVGTSTIQASGIKILPPPPMLTEMH